MGVATGCGCKEAYRFPHTTYPTPLVSVLFCSSIPTFCSLFFLSIHQSGTARPPIKHGGNTVRPPIKHGGNTARPPYKTWWKHREGPL